MTIKRNIMTSTSPEFWNRPT